MSTEAITFTEALKVAMIWKNTLKVFLYGLPGVYYRFFLN